jgi:hypothetical protein
VSKRGNKAALGRLSTPLGLAVAGTAVALVATPLNASAAPNSITSVCGITERKVPTPDAPLHQCAADPILLDDWVGGTSDAGRADRWTCSVVVIVAAIAATPAGGRLATGSAGTLVSGLLIHAWFGIRGAVGRRVNRSGCAAQAASRVACRARRTDSAVPWCTEAGVCNPIPEWRCSWL